MEENRSKEKSMIIRDPAGLVSGAFHCGEDGKFPDFMQKPLTISEKNDTL